MKTLVEFLSEKVSAKELDILGSELDLALFQSSLSQAHYDETWQKFMKMNNADDIKKLIASIKK